MIREMTKSDFQLFWSTFESVVQAQETYAFPVDINFDAAYALWCEHPIKTFVFERDGQVLGSYYIKHNAMGPSDHICNCGYMVSELARGQGIARQLCEHSQTIALDLGFEAMQFNSVVSTNKFAIALWEKLGFNIIGSIPRAYRHAELGYVDSFIMHKSL